MPAYLSAALAQRVVDELRPTIESNLNIMDASGLIVASGDASRVGQFHPAAREAAERGSAVVVEASSARPGERPGINVPLRHGERIVGVVGLTGDPEVVRPIVAVVQLTITLLLDRERELGQQARRDAQDRELLSRLVFGATTKPVIDTLARRHPDIRAPWCAHAVLSGAGDAAGFDPRLLAQLRARTGDAPAVVAVLRGVLWVVGTAARDGRRGTPPATLLDACPADARIVSSVPCFEPEDLAREMTLLSSVVARPGLLPTVRAVDTAALGVELAAAALAPDAATAIARHVVGLRETERVTLRHFLQSGSVAAAASAGFTHRNTVLQRLSRVVEATSLDPRAPGDAATLRLALVLHAEAAAVQGAHARVPHEQET